jgi:hypothetical protein
MNSDTKHQRSANTQHDQRPEKSKWDNDNVDLIRSRVAPPARLDTTKQSILVIEELPKQVSLRQTNADR